MTPQLALVEAPAFDLDDEIESRMAEVEARLNRLAVPSGPVGESIRLIVTGRGKRLRPRCVLLSATLGDGIDETAIELAVAAELLHAATLLHDDVIDDGERRRDRPAARMVHGNAASVLAGDWLLVEVLCRVAEAAPGAPTRRLRSTLCRLVGAEATQLRQRDCLRPDSSIHDAIVGGKTASLFEWAVWSGAFAGGVPHEGRDALVLWASHAAMAFQIVDDVLDFEGDPAITGKTPFRDVEQGFLSYPLLLALQKEPSLRAVLSRRPVDQTAVRSILSRTSAVDGARVRARREADRARAALLLLPSGPVVDRLQAVTTAMAERRS